LAACSQEYFYFLQSIESLVLLWQGYVVEYSSRVLATFMKMVYVVKEMIKRRIFMKKTVFYLGGMIAGIALLIILLLTSVQLVAFNHSYYRSEYRKLDRPNAIGISEENLMKVTDELLKYLQDRREDLLIKTVINGQERYVFNDREIRHMVDVKDLFLRGYSLRRWCVWIVAACLILLWVFAGKRMWRILARSFIAGATLFLLFILLLIGLLQTDFTRYFNRFHYIFFTNDLWQLDPATDVLIQMVPEQFFFDTAFRIIALFIGSVLAAIAGASFYLWRLRKGR